MRGTKEAVARLRSVLDSSPDGVFAVDRELRVVEWSRAMARITGRSAEDVLGRPIADAIPEAGRDASIARARGGEVVEVSGVRYGGTEHGGTAIHEVRYAPLFGGGGEIQGVLAIVRDVSERKRAEEAIAARSEELARSNSELERFAYVASHDLQEPLRVIATQLQLLERRYEGKLGADADRFIGFAVGGARRMQALIRDLLSYSRVETRGQPFLPTRTRDVVRSVLANLADAIKESGARVEVGELPDVAGDASQLAQLFQNLIANALKFRSAEPPRVVVSAHHAAAGPGLVELSVEDNGIGIAPEHHERIFAMFQRLHTEAEYPGTGIGLAICQKIVERHGGRLWVVSELAAGADFRFTLPRA